jgi:hypothetical protein
MSNQPNQKPVPASYFDDNFYREFKRGFEQFEEEENFYPVDWSVKNVLDIGCGRGLWMRRLARIYDFVLTSRATRFLFFKTPLLDLFLSDIWVVAQKRTEVSKR